MTLSLFDALDDPPWQEPICPGAVVLRRFALRDAPAVLAALDDITRLAPWRHMHTPGGYRMSVAMSNCGLYGWVSDTRGYRYDRLDPDSRRAWPPMPAALRGLAEQAAAAAGFDAFAPDACLLNCYEQGAKLSLHQDRDERDFSQPIVSVSLGVAANFQFGGARRNDQSVNIALTHGDVVVWGGPARLNFHGVLPLKDGRHALTGSRRINLTFRKVG